MKVVLSPFKGVEFSSLLIAWQRRCGRQNLPWQHTGEPYKVWLSEVMLQQTQVATVLRYFANFLMAYPTVSHLAVAQEQDVLQRWAGLGYYARARNLHACAKQVVACYGGVFPRTVAELECLPGIGKSTAGAIVSLAYGVCAPILDGNVKRVFCRYYGIQGHPEQALIKKSLWQLAADNVPDAEPGVFNQALMDLGAMCCLPRNPNCRVCPLMHTCVAFNSDLVSQLPTPKPRKTRPELYFVSLIVQDEAQESLLLELQDKKGIWHGLWAPPSAPCSSQPTEAELKALVGHWFKQYELPIDAWGALMQQVLVFDHQPWLVHELTHRKMHFKVLLLKWPAPRVRLFAPTDKPVPKIVDKLIAHAAQSMPLTQGAVAQ